MKKALIIFICLIIHAYSYAQKTKADTTRTVVVTSSFKPSLKTTSKLNFSAANPLPDSARPSLLYDVPAQNLSFTYQSPALKAMAVNIDTGVHWVNSNFIKAGYGNYTTPFLQAGISLGDGVNQVITINGKYTSSKGGLPFQDYSKTHLEALGIFNTSNNNEWSGKLFLKNDNQYQYGFRPDTLLFSKDELKQNFTSFGGKVGLRNKKENDFGLSYNPNIALDIFADNRSGKENNLVLNTPLSKSFGKIFAFNVGFTADITSYSSDSGSVDNNIFYFTPAIRFKTPNFNLTGGFTPSWDNSVFTLLPNFTADIKINEEKFILQAGWVGYYNKTTYESLAGTNPWLQQPKTLLNSRITEQYAGFKGSGGSHFTYNAKVSYLQIVNNPLFVNDTLTGRSFETVYEPELKDIRIHGELGYTLQEKFSFIAGATFNQYSNLTQNEKAWGLLPLEINGALRWRVLKDVMVKSDIYFWDGPQYRNKALQSQKLDPAIDMNAGIEFTVKPQLNLWLQFNNVFNNKYQRWNQYETLGFNVLAGVVYSFDKKNK